MALGYDYGCHNEIGCSQVFKSFVDEKSSDVSDFLISELDLDNLANSEAAIKG